MSAPRKNFSDRPCSKGSPPYGVGGDGGVEKNGLSQKQWGSGMTVKGNGYVLQRRMLSIKVSATTPENHSDFLIHLINPPGRSTCRLNLQ